MNSADFVCQNAQAALDWLESLGVRTKNGRFLVYRRVAQALLERAKNQKGLRGKDTLGLYDLDIFVRAYFQRDKLTQLPETRATLYKMIGGAALYGEDTNRAPRDYQFELECQLELISWGLKLVPPVHGDIEAHLVDQPFLVECKRSANFDRLRQRIAEGLDQISKRRFNGYQTFGLLMLDLTLMCNPFHAHLRSEDELGAIDQIRRYVRDVVTPRLGPLIQEQLVDPGTAGAWCRVLVPCWVNTFGWIQFHYWISIETAAAIVEPRTRAAGKFLQAMMYKHADSALRS